jgi:hypothetical protein
MTQDKELQEPIQAVQLPDFASMTEDQIREFAAQIWQKFADRQQATESASD